MFPKNPNNPQMCDNNPPPQKIIIINLKSPDFCWKNILIDAPCKNLVLVTQKKLIWAMWSMIISSKMAC
jgi:hypothetical protein